MSCFSVNSCRFLAEISLMVLASQVGSVIRSISVAKEHRFQSTGPEDRVACRGRRGVRDRPNISDPFSVE